MRRPGGRRPYPDPVLEGEDVSEASQDRFRSEREGLVALLDRVDHLEQSKRRRSER